MGGRLSQPVELRERRASLPGRSNATRAAVSIIGPSSRRTRAVALGLVFRRVPPQQNARVFEHPANAQPRQVRSAQPGLERQRVQLTPRVRR